MPDERIIQVALRLPAKMHAELKAMADVDRRSVHAEILTILEEAIEGGVNRAAEQQIRGALRAKGYASFQLLHIPVAQLPDGLFRIELAVAGQASPVALYGEPEEVLAKIAALPSH